MSQSSNLFEALNNYGPRTVENYLTKSFVYLLDLLLCREPVAGLEMVNRLCGLDLSHQLTQAGAIQIETQKDLRPHGIVDMTIQCGTDAIFYVEVKLDAPLDGQQLRSYHDHLNLMQGYDHKGLIFLARSREGAIPVWLEKGEYHRVCWYEVYNWLQRLYVHDEIVKYFVADFQSFLESKGTCFRQVSSYYASDPDALENLMLMIKSAIGEAVDGADPRSPRNAELHGFTFGRFFCGIRLARPDILAFEDNKGRSAAHRRVLNFENENFYRRSKDAQFEQIIQFLRKSYAEAH
jgi:hypothetical protein